MAPNGRIRRRDNSNIQNFTGNNQQRFQAPRFQVPNAQSQVPAMAGQLGSGQLSDVPSGNNHWVRFNQPPHQLPPIQENPSDSNSNSHQNIPPTIYIPSGHGPQLSTARTSCF